MHICQSQSPDSSTTHVHMFILYVCISIPAPQLGSSVPHDPVISLLSISPEKTIIQIDTRSPAFTAALFTIAKTWKQPRCPSTDAWMKKLWYMYTMGYYSTIKRNAFESVLMRWMDLEPIVQSEVSQKEKEKYHILMHIYRI